MENLNKEFYSQFIQTLKETIPERGALSKMLCETLSIEKMSVYRRLKGDIPFTFAEIIAIAQHLNISLDNIINVASPYRSMPFRLHLQDYFSLKEIDYKMSSDFIKAIQAAANNPYSEFGFASNLLPLPLMVMFPPVFRFFVMKWMYQFGSVNAMLPFSEIDIPEKLLAFHQEYVKEIQNIKYTFFISNEFALQKLVYDIRYFKSIHLLTEEDVKLLKDCFYQMLAVIEELLINGTFDNGNKIDIYVSELGFETSYSYLSSENINVSMIDAYILGAVTSMDAEATNIMKKWMQSIIRTSTIISGFEKNRIEFIEKRRKLIEDF